MFRFFFIFLTIILLLDLYSFQAIKTLTRHASAGTKRKARIIFWSITGIAVVMFLLAMIFPKLMIHKGWRFTSMAFLTLFYVPKIFIVIFLFMDDLIRIFRWIFMKLSPPKPEITEGGISRSKFLSQSAVVVGGFFFLTMFYGIIKLAYDYQFKRYTLKFPNLPESFNGFRILQISDIHTGSFTMTSPLHRAVKMINEEKADMILFTGDLVNSTSTEANEYIEIFNKMKAPHGVYSIKGNHDYGDYYTWDSDADKKADQDLLDEHHKNLGWTLLKDETVAIERNGESIALIGMENWGKRFQQYGDIHKARKGAEDFPFKILMSHDPTCFQEQISKDHKDIDLTLSGHTHGMQFGISAGNFEWSPASMVYKYWAGLYKVGNQYLNVNRGFGFIGFPGRVGIKPEITVIELRTS